MSDQVAVSDCEHFYATRVRGGEPVSVRACTLCGQPDWPDLREQVERLCEAAAELASELTEVQYGIRVDVAHPHRQEKPGDVITHIAEVRTVLRCREVWDGWTPVKRTLGPWSEVAEQERLSAVSHG